MLLWDSVCLPSKDKLLHCSRVLNVDFVLKLTLENICIYRNMTGYKNRKYSLADKNKALLIARFSLSSVPFLSASEFDVFTLAKTTEESSEEQKKIPSFLLLSENKDKRKNSQCIIKFGKFVLMVKIKTTVRSVDEK